MSVTKTTTYDAFTAEVIQQRLKSIVDEMGITLLRTSGSPVLTEAKDFSTALFDAKGEQVAFAGYITTHLASSKLGVESILRDYPLDQIYPGDHFICNDPHLAGAVHQGDVAVISPLFIEDTLAGWAFSNAHILDVGGMSPGGWAPTAYDRYAEALNLPPIKIVERGKMKEDLKRIIMNNVRLPIPVMNDIKSLIAANMVAGQRLQTLLEKYGLENYQRYCEINKDLSENLIRKRIESVADGAYHTVGYTEYDGHGKEELYYLNMTLRVKGTELEIDLSGSHPQVDCFANSGPGAADGCIYAEYAMEFAYDIPINEGIWRPFKINRGESGTITNPEIPAAVSCGHMETGLKLEKAASEVFNKAFEMSESSWARSRVAGEAHNTWPGNSWTGKDQYGNYTAFPMLDCGSGGGGALNFHDGLDVASVEHQQGNGIPDVETVEMLNPVLYLWRKLNLDSGGAGVWRGGEGLDLAWIPYGTDTLLGTLESGCSEYPANGEMGGYPGGTSIYQICKDFDVLKFISENGRIPNLDKITGFENQLSHASGVELNKTDIFRHLTGGGGGIGDPLLRHPELIEKDIIDGYISIGMAENAYGIVWDYNKQEVNLAATEERRNHLRAERINKEPVKIERSNDFKIPLTLNHQQNELHYHCSHCDHDLGPISDLYKLNALGKSFDLAEELSKFGTVVKPRQTQRPVLKEYYCPECATLLTVDIHTADIDTLHDIVYGVSDVVMLNGRKHNHL